MSKKHTNAVNFLARVADKSMNGYGNAYLDVMPAGAVDLTTEANGIIDQFEILALEKSRWEIVKKHRPLTKEEEKRYSSVRSIYFNLKKTIKEVSDKERGWAFMRVACHILKGEELRKINTEVDKLILYVKTHGRLQ